MDTTPPTSHVNPLPKRANEPQLSRSPSPARMAARPPRASRPMTSTRAQTAGHGRSGPASRRPTHRPRSPGRATQPTRSTASPMTSQATSRVKKPLIEASTYLPDLTPPVTSVNSTTRHQPELGQHQHRHVHPEPDRQRPRAAACSPISKCSSRSIEAPTQSAAYAIPAGSADSTGTVHSTILYQGPTDGASHTYAFYSVGLDAAGNLQGAPAIPNVTFTETSQPPLHPSSR